MSSKLIRTIVPFLIVTKTLKKFNYSIDEMKKLIDTEVTDEYVEEMIIDALNFLSKLGSANFRKGISINRVQRKYASKYDIGDLDDYIAFCKNQSRKVGAAFHGISNDILYLVEQNIEPDMFNKEVIIRISDKCSIRPHETISAMNLLLYHKKITKI